MKEEFAQKTVVVLLIITVMIGFMGALVVLDEADRVRSGNILEFSQAGQSPGTSQARLSVEKPEADFSDGLK